MSTRDGFAAIGRAGLRHIIANEPALLRNDPEGVHQMRVGLRRLRAAMALFADLLQDAQTAVIKGELKWLTQELAPARELEVLIKRVVAPVKKRHVSLDGIPGLSRELSEKRAAALERARSAVTSARFRALTLEIAAWLETGHWTSPHGDHVRAQGDAPIEASATAELKRRWKKIRKKGKMLARLDAKGRHKLRIQAKKVRYATEFFAPLLSGKRAPKRRKKFLNALERLQDTLGDLNDIVVHEDLITAMRRGRRRSSPKRAFAAGLLTGREDARLDAALAAAVDACGGVAKVKPFWR
jgi:CHAD domain-containing protein